MAVSGGLRQPEAILLDLDGTLIDSAPDMHEAARRLLEQEGLPPIGLDALKRCIGDGMAALLQRVFAEAGKNLDAAEAVRVRETYLDIYAAIPASPDCVYPGVREFLQKQKAAGVKLGVCTNKIETAARRVLRQTGLAPLLGVVVGGDTASDKKPSPLPLLHALASLQAQGENSVMIGDHINDVLAARAARMHVIGVTYGYTEEWAGPAQPHAFAASMAECGKAVDALFAASQQNNFA